MKCVPPNVLLSSSKKCVSPTFRAVTNAVHCLPNALLTWILIMLVAGGVLLFTRYGRFVYAVGANCEAARYAGVPTREVVVACYVACDPASLARDVKTFAAHGYRLAQLRAFDLFPMTAHVECVGLLERT